MKLLQLVERLRFVRALAGEDLEQDQAERMNIGCGRRSGACELFRRHVLRRPRNLRAGIVRRRGDSKIGDANVALAVEHHVRRLQIAVDDAAVVRRRDAGAQLPRDVERFVLRKAPDAAEQRAEILAVHVLHRQKRTAVRFAEVVEADDVLVRHLPRDAQLVVKLGQTRCVARDGLGQELQRHRLIERQILGAIDLAHAAAAEHRDEAISAGNDRAGCEALRVGSRARHRGDGRRRDAQRRIVV